MVPRVLVEALVWTVVVEVSLVLANDAVRVPLVVDQDPIGALSADAANEPLRVAVGLRRPRWSPDNLHAFGSEYFINSAGELRVSVVNQEPEGRGSLTKIPTIDGRLLHVATAAAIISVLCVAANQFMYGISEMLTMGSWSTATLFIGDTPPIARVTWTADTQVPDTY